MDHTQAKLLLRRFIHMFAGFLLMGIGCAMQVQAMLGYGSWTVLDHGLTNYLPVTIGVASILSSAVIIVIDVLAGEKIGVGMPFNMVVVGLLIDLFLASGLIPTMPGLLGAGGGFDPAGTALSLLMLLGGILLVSLSTCIYIQAGLGAGPRDTLMVVLMKLTGRDIAICRNSLELLALGVGWLLGGSVGVGTVMVALLSGPATQMFSRMLRVDPKTIRHITFDMLPGLLTGRVRIDGEETQPDPAQATEPCAEEAGSVTEG